MTPKEEAKELVDKFVNGVTDEEGTPSIYYSEAKQCALIAVDEILNIIDRDMNYQNVYSFYLDVKQEIEQL